MSSITVVQADEAVVHVRLAGSLDDDVGSQLVELTHIALSVSPTVVIDVSVVTEWTSDGRDAALAMC